MSTGAIIGKEIKKLRLKAKYPSKRLGIKIGMSEAYIVQLERIAIKKPKIEVIVAILRELGLSKGEIDRFIKEWYVFDIEHKNTGTREFKLNIASEEELDLMFKNDAVTIYNSIKSLPSKTKAFLKDMLENE